jgi:hypothetical protein
MKNELDHISKLKEIGLVLIEDEVDYLNLANILEAYKALLNNLTSLDSYDQKYLSDVESAGGKAIGTNWAALCLDDLLRTKTFVNGTFKAIKEQLKVGEKPIKLLYAGTGPFATLLLPILPFFSPEELQVGLLEINPVSFEMLKDVFKKLELQPYVSDFYLEDAVTFQFQKSEAFDLILSETMQNALRDEPQVSIAFNLMQQFPKALLIPENIQIRVGFFDSGLTDKQNELNVKVFPLETIFELNSKTALAFSSGRKFPSITLECRPNDWKGYHYCSLFTEIQVFGNQKLTINQSGLTIPHFLFALNDLEPKGLNLSFQYETGSRPGFRFTITK